MTRDPAAALVAWRKSTGYTQAEAGALFGVCRSMVGHWERGRSAFPVSVRARLVAEGWLRRPRAWDHWEPEHDTWLLAHVGRWPSVELAARLTAAFGLVRTQAAVERRLYVYHQSIQVQALLTRQQVARLCGVAPHTVSMWVARGWLQLPAWSRRGLRGHWAVPPAALAAFIAAHAIQLSPAAMPPSEYRDQATALWARERWLSTTQVAAYVGINRRTLGQWIAAGAVPATRAYRHGRFWWMIRARDLAAFLRTREQRRAA